MLESDEILFVDNLCRTCLEPANDLRSLFKVGRICGQKTKLSLMLIESFAIEVSENDGLPEKICSKCMIQISKSYNFKLQCIKSENVLRTKLVNTQPVFKTTEELENELSDEPIAVPIPLKMEFYDNAGNTEEEEVEEANYPTERLQSINEHDEMELELEEVVDENEEIIIEHSEVTDEYTIKVCEDNDNSVSIEYASCYDDKYETETATEDQHLDMENDGLSGAPSVLKPEAKKKFPCTICLKVLSNANSFKYHMQLHSDEKPFLCNECGERFKTPNAYAGHMSTHKTEYQHKCDKCDKVYRQAASLRSHQLTHTGEKPFVCNICGKGVTQKSGFKKHMLIHSGEKPYECDICFNKFRFSSNLAQHKRSHTGEKPYECEECGKCLLTSEGLRNHKLTHTGEKPFSCETCGKCFNRRSTLAVHQNIHAGVKSYECKFCHKYFIQLRAMKLHIQTHHSTELKEGNST